VPTYAPGDGRTGLASPTAHSVVVGELHQDDFAGAGPDLQRRAVERDDIATNALAGGLAIAIRGDPAAGGKVLPCMYCIAASRKWVGARNRGRCRGIVRKKAAPKVTGGASRTGGIREFA